MENRFIEFVVLGGIVGTSIWRSGVHRVGVVGGVSSVDISATRHGIAGRWGYVLAEHRAKKNEAGDIGIHLKNLVFSSDHG